MTFVAPTEASKNREIVTANSSTSAHSAEPAPEPGDFISRHQSDDICTMVAGSLTTSGATLAPIPFNESQLLTA